MRRSTLTAVAGLSLFALITACATSPEDDLGEATQEQKSAEPPPEKNSTKLPPANNGIDASTPDTGKGSTSSSSGASSSGASSSGSTSSSGASGSSTSSSGASGTSGGSSSGSSSGTVGAACDMSNPLKLILYQAEVANQSSPVPCPCAATKCCYLGITCVTK